jgi:hypothetical protein
MNLQQCLFPGDVSWQVSSNSEQSSSSLHVINPALTPSGHCSDPIGATAVVAGGEIVVGGVPQQCFFPGDVSRQLSSNVEHSSSSEHSRKPALTPSGHCSALTTGVWVVGGAIVVEGVPQQCFFPGDVFRQLSSNVEHSSSSEHSRKPALTPSGHTSASRAFPPKCTGIQALRMIPGLTAMFVSWRRFQAVKFKCGTFILVCTFKKASFHTVRTLLWCWIRSSYWTYT